jgi:hypothetical protein
MAVGSTLGWRAARGFKGKFAEPVDVTKGRVMSKVNSFIFANEVGKERNVAVYVA